ncbi:hypothetical protein [Bradyrhizobium iriomotense]|uniref:Uncharacterized protein n=1 Tax=Bradyrhizobium iriomotense TaxID=441950 RepID=A0ABQ6BAE1_9BRAD|nr:hypothetical protein [Bradyrhizobium iriomotense]GLR91325.1 hypothetical protein GCM10007857_80420 [Bradyrhizobium iriomotense]
MGKTGPKCTVCNSKHRHQIEIGLAHGIAHNALARRFNVSADAVGRHAANHVSPAMRAAILTAQQPTTIDLEALQASEQEGLLSQLVHQRARLQQHVATAIDFGDIKAAISAEGAITANLALVGKLLGMIVQRHDVRSTSLHISADYLATRQAIVTALRPYPEAARAVAAVLYKLESDAAKDITQRAGKPPLVIDAKPLPPCPVSLPC